MKRRRRFEPMTGGKRLPADDLLCAFILAGWETIMPLQEAVETADYLAWDDPIKAQRLGGTLVRGEPMPNDIQTWINSVRNSKRSYLPSH